MQFWMRKTLAAAALFAFAIPTLAQDAPKPAAPPAGTAAPGTAAPAPARQGRRAPRGLSLAVLPVAVLDMLTPLKDEQKTKITGIQDKAKTDVAAADATAKTGVTTKAAADVKAVLTTDQVSALDKAMPMLTLINQSKVIPIAALPDVKLTKDQMDKISALTEQENAKTKGLKGQERRDKMKEVSADFKTQVEALLTADQKAAIAKYEAAHPAKKANAA